ncbi:MAG: ROK family transcriptional regulator [Acidobacteriota bacterium]|nr:ROK family transcriptional regulator [Acidobacteriota bacterium]
MASSEIARDINRSSVLDLIRTNQPVSRADVARRTGLQRSTVSLIVDELISERWVAEGDLGQVPLGRRPRLLYLNTDRAGIIGINIMPRLTTIALADLNVTFRAEESIPTSSDPNTFTTVLISTVRRLIGQHPDMVYEGIGVSVPGRVDYLSQRLVFAPNLGWRQVDLKQPLETSTGLPVQIENAANACALAEVWSGPHKGLSDLIAVTVSEGIGTGIVANGQLVRGPSGAAGEFGHVCMDSQGPNCKCGGRGCWEAYASNSAAIRNYSQGSSRSHKPDEMITKDPITSFADILSMAERGDRKASDVLDIMARYLGLGMAMLVNGLAPSVIVVVGEVTRAWKRVGPLVQSVVQECARTHASTRIVPADDVTQPRLRGTIALVLQKHFRPRLVA